MSDDLTPPRIADCLEAAPQLRLVSGSTDLDRRVRAIRVWDVSRPADEYGEALVFVPGAPAEGQPGLGNVLDRCASAGAVGAVVRGRVDTTWAELVGDRTSLALLTYPSDLPWDEAYDVCRDLVGGRGGPDEIEVVLQAAAACLDVSLLLEDRGSRRIGHAAVDGVLDPAAEVSVVTGCAPAAVVEWMRTSGAGSRLEASDEPMLIESPEFGMRWGVAVRGPQGVLGRLWVVGGIVSGDPVDLSVLSDFAHRLARVLHGHSFATREVSRLDHLMRGLLAGGALRAAVARGWGVSEEEPVRLIALSHCVPDFHVPADLFVLSAIVEARLFATSARGQVVRVGNAVYLVARSIELSEDGALRIAEESIRHYAAHSGRNVVAVVGNDSVTLANIGAAKAELDRAMRLLAATGVSGASTYDKLAISAFFAELRELVADRPRLLEGPLEAVLSLDAAGRTDYVATLQAYFSANCDLGRAARLLYVHRNTLKYRLERLKELIGLDLDDAVARCAVEVQLRLLHDF